jgi:hypothetical protein
MVEVSKSLLRFGCSISERCSELERLALCTVAVISGVASGRGSSVRRGCCCGGGDLCASLGVSCGVLVDSGGDTSVGGGVGNSVSSTSMGLSCAPVSPWAGEHKDLFLAAGLGGDMCMGSPVLGWAPLAASVLGSGFGFEASVRSNASWAACVACSASFADATAGFTLDCLGAFCWGGCTGSAIACLSACGWGDSTGSPAVFCRCGIRMGFLSTAGGSPGSPVGFFAVVLDSSVFTCALALVSPALTAAACGGSCGTAECAAVLG